MTIRTFGRLRFLLRGPQTIKMEASKTSDNAYKLPAMSIDNGGFGFLVGRNKKMFDAELVYNQARDEMLSGLKNRNATAWQITLCKMITEDMAERGITPRAAYKRLWRNRLVDESDHINRDREIVFSYCTHVARIVGRAGPTTDDLYSALGLAIADDCNEEATVHPIAVEVDADGQPIFQLRGERVSDRPNRDRHRRRQRALAEPVTLEEVADILAEPPPELDKRYEERDIVGLMRRLQACINTDRSGSEYLMREIRAYVGQWGGDFIVEMDADGEARAHFTPATRAGIDRRDMIEITTLDGRTIQRIR